MSNPLEDKALLAAQGALCTNEEAIDELYTLLHQFAIRWRDWILAQRQDVPNVFKEMDDDQD